MRVEIVFELDDEVIIPTDVASAYEEYRGKSGKVVIQNCNNLGVRFADGTYAEFDRHSNILRPKNLKISYQ